MNTFVNKTYRSNTHTSHGFTLVETLIAIAVLMISIAGPLVIATKGLTSALYSKDQMIASFLAQESMEVIKNTRDNNVSGAGVGVNVEDVWLENLNCNDEDLCDATGIGGDRFSYCNGSGDPGCPIYYDEETGYNTDGIGVQTQFYRHFYVDNVSSSLTSEGRVHVIVDWYERSIPFRIHLTSTITASVR